MSLSAVPLPVINWNEVFEKSKYIRLIGSLVTGCHFGWKFLRWLSLSGASKNPLIRYLHFLLRRYMNCGFLMRSEFGVHLPWQYMFLFPGNYCIVNYGSYGTVPNKVMEYHVKLQKEYEICPDHYARVTLPKKYNESLEIVAAAVGCSWSNVVFVENITEGIGCVMRSFLPKFDNDDAVLYINIGYSTVLKSIEVNTRKYHVRKYQLDFTYPILSEDDVCNAFEEMFQNHDNIRLAVFDHITSASATLLPVQKIAEICRKYDVISVVDGAHAPGQLQLKIESYGVDVYIGNLHKWYYTPKSCAIMYIHPKHCHTMQPSLVSHQWCGDLQNRFRVQGTKSYAAQVTAGYAVGTFMQNIGGIEFLHSYITPLVEFAVDLFTREWGTTELQIPDSMKAPYMRIVFLPDVFTQVGGPTQEDSDNMMIEILREYNIAIFINPISGRQSVRVSAQIFSTKAEYIAVAKVIKKEARLIQTGKRKYRAK